MTPISKALRMWCVWTIVLLIPRASTGQNAALHIAIVSGEDATHPAGARVVKPITIEVTDAAGQPVEGARTSFQLPEDGPGGLLASGLRTDVAVTDSHGRATLRGFQLNRTPGPFNVRVTVAKEQARAGIVVRQRIGEAGAATGSADRQAQPSAVKAAAEPVPLVKETPSKAEPVKAPATVRPTRAAAPRGIEASAQTAPVIRPAVTESTGAASRPTRTQTIVVTQKPSRAAGGSGASSGGKSHKKWVLLGILAAGGAAGAFASSSLGTAAAAHNPGLAPGLNSSVSIGTPTITIGKP